MEGRQSVAKINMEDFADITDLIEAIKMEICDHYCKWPEQYSFDGTSYQDGEQLERMIDERCEGCPLDLL